MSARSSEIVNGVSKKVTEPPPFLRKGDRLQPTLVSTSVAVWSWAEAWKRTSRL